MAEAATLAYRQWRLERRMFWRNPTAAFFSFILPLLFLFLFGAIFSGDHKALNVIVPGILGMSVMSTTFNALAMNITFLREDGGAQARPRHADARGVVSGRLDRQRRLERRRADHRHHTGPAGCSSASAGRRTGLSLRSSPPLAWRRLRRSASRSPTRSPTSTPRPRI